jgi:DNA helicase II / ATP-dependent DNA helicase PcrA
VPADLIVELGVRDEPGEVDLFSERHDARQAARRGTYTGKTYNSLDNISQFFGERGVPFNAGKPGGPPRPPAPQAQRPGAVPPWSSTPQQPPVQAGQRPAAPAGPPAQRRGARTGMIVEHPKYGSGTVVRREGEGDDAKITVNFPRFGLKKLVEKYAGLKRS